MKRWRAVAAVVAGAAAIGWISPVRAASQDVRKELEAIYAQVAQASMAPDNSAAKQLLQERTTADFHIDQIKPKRFALTRQMMMANLEKVFDHGFPGLVVLAFRSSGLGGVCGLPLGSRVYVGS